MRHIKVASDGTIIRFNHFSKYCRVPSKISNFITRHLHGTSTKKIE